MRKFHDSMLVPVARGSLLGLAALLLSQCSSDAREFDDAVGGGSAGTDGAAGGGNVSGAGASSSGASNAGASTGGQMAGSGGSQASGGDDSGSNDGGADSSGGTTGVAGTSGAGGNGGGTGGDINQTCTSACLDNGAACTAASECKSARCVDGVCCDGPCDDVCQACSEELTGAANGVCASVKKGTDPHDDCATEAASSCGQTGLCGPGGACALYDANTVCKAASCSAGSAKSAQKCDGSGICKAATSTACSPYVCGADACLSSCSKNADCASGNVCVNGGCQPPSDLLGACDETADCAKGDCISKMCGLSIKSIRITGAQGTGGGSQIMFDGWFKTDSTGHNKVRVSTISVTQYLWQSLDVTSQLMTALPPNNYLALTGAEGSNPLTRTFQFNLSDGSSITKSVQVSSSEEILLSEGSGDDFMLFQWTGATVNVLPKTY